MLDGIVQGRPVAVARIERRTRRKEQLHDVRVAHVGRRDEGRAAVGASGLEPRPRVEECLHAREARGLARDVQWRAPVGCGEVE